MDESPTREQRPAHRPPEPPVGGSAFDNHAYQPDQPDDAHARAENDANHNVTASESFGANGAANGTNPYDNDKATYEAVNLELINLAPKNGQHGQNGQTKDTSKKDVEVDIPSNHYDEYFVPVNEHKKSLRGEKLYVMADKRGKGGCRHRLCWTLGVLLLLAAILVAILAATGVFTSTATPVDQYNSTISTARALGGISSGFEKTDHSDHDHNAHDHEHDHGHDHKDHDHSHEQPTPEPEPEPSNDHEQPTPEPEPSNDHKQPTPEPEPSNDHKQPTPKPEPTQKSDDVTTQQPIHNEAKHKEHVPEQETEMDQNRHREDTEGGHVETAIIGPSGSIDTETNAFEDDSMYVPRTVEGVLKIDNEQLQADMLDDSSATFRQLSDTLTRAISRAVLDGHNAADNDVRIEIVSLRPGSVIVTYRVHWTPKSENVPDPLTPDTLKSRLSEYLDRNNRMLSVYHVAKDQLQASRVLDVCQDDSNGCEYGCEFDSISLDFKCTCPDGKVPDMTNPKTCVHPMDNSLYKPITETESDNEKAFKVLNISNESEHTPFIHSTEEPMTFDWLGSVTPSSRPTTVSNSNLEHSHIFGIPNTEASNVEPSAEPSPEPSSEPEPEPKGEPVGSHEETTTESHTNLNMERSSVVTSPQPEPTSEPKSEPTTEQDPMSEPPNVNAEGETTSEISQKKTAASSFSEPFNSASFWFNHPLSSTETTPEPISEPKPEPVPETTPEVVTEIKLQPASSEIPIPLNVGRSFESSTETKTTDASPTELLEPEQSTDTHLNPEQASEPNMETTTEMESGDELTTEYTSGSKSKGIHQEESITGLTNQSEIMSEPEEERALEPTLPPTANEFIDEKVVALAESVYKNNKQSMNNSTESMEVSEDYNSKSQEIFNTDNESVQNSSMEMNISNVRSENSDQNSISNLVSHREIKFSPADNNQFSKEETDNRINKKEISKEEPAEAKVEQEDAMNKTENNQRTDEGRNIKYAQRTETMLSGSEESASSTNSAEITRPNDAEKNSLKSNEEDKSSSVFLLNDLKKVTDPANKQNEQNNENISEEKSSQSAEEMNSSSSKEIIMNVNKKLEDSVTKAITSTELVDVVNKPPELLTPVNIVTYSADNQTNTTTSEPAVTEYVIDENEDNETTETPSPDADWLSSGNEEENETQENITGSPILGINEHEHAADSIDNDYIINSADKEKDDMPQYGILADYDTANNRGKRIEDSKMVENVTSTTEKILPTEKMVGDYIYNGQVNYNENINNKPVFNNTEDINEEPAPVWEHSEIEPEQVFYNNEEVTNEPTTVSQGINSTVIVATTSPQTPLESSLNKNSESRNLNVTVYEVPGNNTKLTKGEYSGERKSDAEEHDSEMNPFLPEIDNNKSLVKKLHEGQDLEPSNINETQNEHAEEVSLEETQSKELKVNATTDVSTNSESAVSEENDQENNKSVNKSKELEGRNSENVMNNSNNVNETLYKETSATSTITSKDVSSKPPTSTFLTDVSDLVPSKGWTKTEDTTPSHLESDNEMSMDTNLRDHPLDIHSTTLRTVSSIHDIFEMELKTNAPTVDQSFSEDAETNDPLSIIPIKSGKKMEKKAANDFLQKKSNKSAKLQENNFNDISDDSENSRTLDYSNYNPSSNSEQQ